MSKRIHGFTRVVADFIHDKIEAMSREELESIIKECNNLSTRNCTWVQYDIRLVVLEIAKDNLEHLNYTEEQDRLTG